MTPRTTRELVAIPRPEGLLLVNRRTLNAVTLPSGMETQLRAALVTNAASPPPWLGNAMNAVGVSPKLVGAWANDFIVRERTELDIRRISWEITERCNFRCVHCYLGERSRPGLPLDERLQLLDKLERAGCLWLQITGGEALADPLFEQTYRAAWNRGLMVSVLTNGLFLSRWINLFRELPPRRVTVSLYGASCGSYSAMTGAPSYAFETVIDGLDAARSAGVRLRVSIIAARPNAHEVAAMEEILHNMAIEYHTYSRLVPTVQGNRNPMNFAVDIGRIPVFFRPKTECAGGKLALHVHVSGQASPCKLLPYISVNLLSEDISMLTRMIHHPGSKPTTPECETCSSSSQCMTCAPILALHKKAGVIPHHICHRHARDFNTSQGNQSTELVPENRTG